MDGKKRQNAERHRRICVCAYTGSDKIKIIQTKFQYCCSRFSPPMKGGECFQYLSTHGKDVSKESIQINRYLTYTRNPTLAQYNQLKRRNSWFIFARNRHSGITNNWPWQQQKSGSETNQWNENKETSQLYPFRMKIGCIRGGGGIMDTLIGCCCLLNRLAAIIRSR